MPEIWLRYGTTDVVLDIKFDNLLGQASCPAQALPEDRVRAAVEGVPLSDNMLVLALSPSKSVSKVVLMLAQAARARGFSVTVDVPPKMAGHLRANLTSLPEGESMSINRAEYHSLQERIGKFQSTVAVSAVTYDPLFGFAGAPTAILRNFLPAKMAEAFAARADNLPSPGEIGNPFRTASSCAEGISCTSVELVQGSSGIAEVHIGTLHEAFEKAAAQLKSISTVEADPCRCAVMSASSEASVQGTLSSSLNSLWNNIHMVKEGGVAILLAESREGLGGGALQMAAEGSLGPEQIAGAAYVDGLEHLLFAAELRQKYELGLVSTLPRYYSGSKLGFTAYAGMSDVLQKLIEKLGKSYRALVLSDADITLFRPRI